MQKILVGLGASVLISAALMAGTWFLLPRQGLVPAVQTAPEAATDFLATHTVSPVAKAAILRLQAVRAVPHADAQHDLADTALGVLLLPDALSAKEAACLQEAAALVDEPALSPKDVAAFRRTHRPLLERVVASRARGEGERQAGGLVKVSSAFAATSSSAVDLSACRALLTAHSKTYADRFPTEGPTLALLGQLQVAAARRAEEPAAAALCAVIGTRLLGLSPLAQREVETLAEASAALAAPAFDPERCAVVGAKLLASARSRPARKPAKAWPRR